MIGPAPDFEQLTSLFKLLSDGTRLGILLLLAEGERNVSSLCEALDLPQPTASHHLGLLRMNGVINNRRAGKQVFYALNGRIDPAADRLEIRVDDFVVTIATRAPTADGDGRALGRIDGRRLDGRIDGRAGFDGRAILDGDDKLDGEALLDGRGAR